LRRYVKRVSVMVSSKCLAIVKRPSQHQAQGRGGALGIQVAGGGELGVGGEYAGDEERHGAIALGAAACRQQAIEAQLLEGAEYGGHVAAGP